ncbi:holocytochrome c synthase [Polyrhizophydium stewartii]|uniref:Holocytochrome c-type synthase n=1 Tax=Polyrhizophydium stewartii TaxID=2732419 RepID=A0ABR4NDT1_9FUNG
MSEAPKCPVDHTKFARHGTNAGAGAGASGTAGASDAPKCPVDHTKFSGSARLTHGDGLNPDNMMPNLTQDMAPGQTIKLPTERTMSSIPKSDGGVWEYPSPQQFFNALKRKGKEAPEHEISGMVDIHNFLNEAGWLEIMKWESKYHCDCKDVKLVKFQGRPDDLSPKAWFYTTFRGVERPFDRHDWTVERCGTPVRYVIDYYSGPDEGANPVFNLDVRPALDSPASVFDRLREGASRLWDKIFK